MAFWELSTFKMWTFMMLKLTTAFNMLKAEKTIEKAATVGKVVSFP